MFPANITRAEAQARSQLIRTESYAVELDLSDAGGASVGIDNLGDRPDAETQFRSKSTIVFSSDAGATHLDLIADELRSITLDSQPLPVADFTGERYPLTLTAGEHRLEVEAVCRYSRTGEGLHRFVDPADGRTYLYSQFEVADSRRAFAVFEQPDLKASFQFTVLAPADWQVFSNAPTPVAEPVSASVARWVFAPTPPISSYITAICAGDFYVVEDEYQGSQTIPLSVACRRSLAEHLDADRIISTTKSGFDVFLAAFQVPYPFADYAQIFVPEFNFGAMENAGCVTFRDEYVFRSRVTAAQFEARDNTILHEMAHMWFGDLVTMQWWDDLWLNESFAEFASHYAQEQIAAAGGQWSQPWVTFANQRKTWAYRQDQLPTTHPIAADMVDLEAVEHCFDGITYAKGASALRQLVAAVGQDDFLRGVSSYFKKHAFGNTQLSDLLVELESASGRDLSYFTNQWLGAAGVNTLSADFEVRDGRFSRFTIVQESDSTIARTHRLRVAGFALADGQLTRAWTHELDIDGERTDISELVGVAQPDLLLLNDGDLTYAKVRLDDRSLATLRTHLPVLDDALARALCWSTAWDMCRDAELSATDYLQLVLAGIGSESDLTAVRALLSQAQTAVSYYSSAKTKPQLAQQWHSGLVARLSEATAGSDHQLAFAQAVIWSAPVGSAPLLQAWLAGSQVPVGLAIDADLRWRIIRSLSRLAVVGEAEIAAELTRDHTATGQENAFAARAARPCAQAKAEAWRLLVETAEVPNETHVQGCSTFWQFDQDEVLVPYLERYLEAISDISAGTNGWARRSSTIRNNVLEMLFPKPLADRAFMARLDAYLDENPPVATVARVVAERRDDALRALRCQER